MSVLEPIRERTEVMAEESHSAAQTASEFMEQLSRDGNLVLADDVEYDIEGLERIFGIDTSEIDSEEELESGVSKLRTYMEEMEIEAKANLAALKYAREKDLEPDYDRPIESWQQLGELQRSISSMPTKVNDKYDRFSEGVDRELLELMEAHVEGIDEVDALPIIEGVAESLEVIEEERRNLMESARDEHSRRSTDYDRPEIPTDPVDWESFIEEEDLSVRNYIDIDGIEGATYGNTLHLMMEEALQERKGLNVEQHLHYIFPDRPSEKDPRPDVLGDLMVYDFKHMPRDQRSNVERNGCIDHRTPHSIEDVRQMNSYLHDLDLPVGILVYVSTDMDVEEYVVEKHTITGPEVYRSKFLNEDYDERFVFEKDEYDFDDVLKAL